VFNHCPEGLDCLSSQEGRLRQRLCQENPSFVRPAEPTPYTLPPTHEARLAAAGASGTPEVGFVLLARDPDQGVRLALARNPATPESALAVLRGDKLPEIRQLTAGTPGPRFESFDLPEPRHATAPHEETEEEAAERRLREASQYQRVRLALGEIEYRPELADSPDII
jgi:hypothetical protein